MSCVCSSFGTPLPAGQPPGMLREASGFVFFNFPCYQQLGCCGEDCIPARMSPLPRGFATMATAGCVCVCVCVCDTPPPPPPAGSAPWWCQVPINGVRLGNSPCQRRVGGGFGLSAKGLQPNGMSRARDIPSWEGGGRDVSHMDPKALGCRPWCPPWSLSYIPMGKNLLTRQDLC